MQAAPHYPVLRNLEYIWEEIVHNNKYHVVLHTQVALRRAAAHKRDGVLQVWLRPRLSVKTP